MSQFTSFAVAGGTGRVGSSIVAGLLSAGAKQVIVLSRSADAKVPAGVTVKAVDINSVESIAEAIKGVDVFISALGGFPPPASQGPILARAAKAAGVRLHVPNEFAMNSRRYGPDAPIYYKKETRDLLQEIGQPALHIACGVFLDMFFAPVFGFNFAQQKVNVVGSKEQYHTLTTIKDSGAFIGKLLVQVPADELLELGDVRVQGDRVSLAQAIEIYEQLHPGKKLEVSYTSIEDAKAELATVEGIEYYLKWFRVVWAQGWNDLEEGGEVAVDNALVEDWQPTSVKEHLASL